MTNDPSDTEGSEVDENLRRVFERTLSEDLPDRFKDLLDQLRASETKTGDDALDRDE